MHIQLKRLLPILAVIGAAMFLITIFPSATSEPAFLAGDGSNREAAEAELAKLQALHPISIDNVDFRRAVERLTQAARISTVWLFTPNGRVIYSAGSTAAFGDTKENAEELASIDVRGTIDALPEELLNEEQRIMLLAASYIRAEWSHNDIYRHMVRSIKMEDGSIVALIGVNYDIFYGRERFSLLESIIGLVMRLGGFALYWLSIPVWVFLDAKDRGERRWVWAIFVFIGNLVAWIAYLLTCRPSPKDTPSH